MDVEERSRAELHDTVPAVDHPSNSADAESKRWRMRPFSWASTRSPDWLPAPWDAFFVGYLAALALPALLTLLDWLIFRAFTFFALPGALLLLGTLIVSLLWGNGPAILATLVGCLLLNAVVLHRSLAWGPLLLQVLLETVVFVGVGVAISLVVSRTEYAREEAERARVQMEQERARAASQAEELEAILNAIADGVYVYDTKRNVRRTNRAGQTFNPYTTQKEYLERPYPERFEQFQVSDAQGRPLSADEQPPSRVLRGEVLKGAQTADVMVRGVDGNELLFSVSGAPILDATGKIHGAVVVTRDVTERVQLERQSAEQAQQLAVLFDAVPEAITVTDAQGRLVRNNEAARNLLRRYMSEIVDGMEERMIAVEAYTLDGKRITAEDATTTRVLQGEVLTGEKARDILVRTVTGEELWLNVAGVPLYDDKGTITGVITVSRDLTPLRRSTRRSREALYALLQFAEALVQADMVGEPEDEDGREATREDGLDLVAQQLAALVSQVSGYPAVGLTMFKEGTQEFLATASYGLTTEQEQSWRARRPGFTIGELVNPQLQRRLQAGETGVIDLSKLPPERASAYGKRKILLVPMILQGRQMGIVTFASSEDALDFTEDELALTKGLAQLAALTLERARLAQDRTRAQAEVIALAEANRLMDEFIGIAGHELRTPLTTVKASVQLARRQVNKLLKMQERLLPEAMTLAGAIQSHLDRSERQIAMQNRLVSDLLDVARLHSNRLELHPDLCDLAALVTDSVEDQLYLIPTRTITLTKKTPEEVLVLADTDRLRQVIGNFLSNALKYSDADRPVEICLQTNGRQARVSVRDEGPGLSKEQQQRIWERFYRVPEVEVRSGSGVGLGLGLHISRMIIERQGGHVGVDSAPGQGSTFWFTLPLAERQ